MATAYESRVAGLVKRYAPAGWRLRWSRAKNPLRASCHAHWEKREILAPHPKRGRAHLAVFLHECAHYHLKHWTAGHGECHVQEFEAERWAMDAMRRHGIAVPREAIEAAKRYVRLCIAHDRLAGVPIEPHVRRWSGWTPGVTAR